MKIQQLTDYYATKRQVNSKAKFVKKLFSYKKTIKAFDINSLVSVNCAQINNKYKQDLAHGLSIELKEDIKPVQLYPVLTRDEFISEIKSLKEMNYISSPQNIQNGIFCADLHSHSNYSDGTASVQEIMDQASKYANVLHARTGKNFIFALSDHDGCDGVVEALKIIAHNTEKLDTLNLSLQQNSAFQWNQKLAVQNIHKDISQ